MGLLETILIPLLIAIVLPIAFSFIWFFKVRGEKMLPSEGTIRTRSPKVISGFFLGFALLVLLGGTAAVIYCCITDKENTTAGAVIALTLCVVGFSALGFFGYALVRFNYVVADNEGMLVFELFRKKRYYRYEEIGCFQDTLSLGMFGDLIGYNKENKKIFSIAALYIGATAVAQRLRDHGIEEKASNTIKF